MTGPDRRRPKAAKPAKGAPRARTNQPGRNSPPPVRRRAGGPARPSAPRGLGGDQVEGRRAVRELLAASKRRVREVWISEEVDASEILDEISDLALGLRVPVRRVGAGRLGATARTDSPQGVLALADPLAEVALEDLLASKGPGAPFLIVVDGVTDPHNLGALMRSAEAAGVTGVILPRHRAAHVTPAVTKAAAGAIEYLPMAIVPGIPSALGAFAEAGVWTIGLEPKASSSIYNLDLAAEPVALVVGAEGRGLSRLVAKRCDSLARIPQLGQGASLNVSAAAAVACFEIARRRHNG